MQLEYVTISNPFLSVTRHTVVLTQSLMNSFDSIIDSISSSVRWEAFAFLLNILSKNDIVFVCKEIKLFFFIFCSLDICQTIFSVLNSFSKIKQILLCDRFHFIHMWHRVFVKKFEDLSFYSQQLHSLTHFISDFCMI